MNYTTDEKLKIYENAQRFAGSFVKCLISAYIIADNVNAAKIEKAFPEYLKQYLKM